MVYLPGGWFKNPDNREIVTNLLNDITDTVDLYAESENIIQKLKELGETIILEHFENNEIAFDS